MRITRRTLLLGAGAGALGVLLVSCTPEPEPSPTATRTPRPKPTSLLPAPSAVTRSTWTTDSFAYGAASFTPVGVQPESRTALAEPIQERMLFAGEATDVDAPGTMRGAIASGARAAEDTLALAAEGERIAVIGAGLAGATAAARLSAGGVEVTVFEARDRLGGRMQSLVDEAWPVPVQLGGWLLGPDDADLRERLRRADIDVFELSEPVSLSPQEGLEIAGDEPVTRAITAAQSLPADVALVQALTDSGADPADPAMAARLAWIAAFSGADAKQASAWFPPALPAADWTAPAGDLGAVLEEMLDGIQVRLSSPVSRIAYDDTGVSIRLGTGEALSFDRVIVTVPLGVLQQNGIEFHPALPFAHRGAIAALGMGAIETIWMRFDEPFWDTDATIWHLVGGDGTVRTWFNLLPGTGENVLVGVVGAAASAEFAALDDDDATASALSSLEFLAGADASG